MNDNKIQILIADDHELFRKGIISLLIGEENIQIVGEANNGKDLIYKFLKLKPNLIISDISMPELSGLEAVSTLLESNPDLKVIFLSMYAGEDYIYHCIKAGGLGLINKDIPKAELIKAIDTVYNGKKYFGKDYTEEKLRKLIRDYDKQLDEIKTVQEVEFTDQEEAIILLIAEGYTSIDIADELYISKRTVDTHRSNLLHKLQLKSGPQLLKYALNFAEEHKKKKLKG